MTQVVDHLQKKYLINLMDILNYLKIYLWKNYFILNGIKDGVKYIHKNLLNLIYL